MSHPMDFPRDEPSVTTAEEAMAHHELIPDELLEESGYDHPEGTVSKQSPQGDVSIQDPEGQRHVARANETLEG